MMSTRRPQKVNGGFEQWLGCAKAMDSECNGRFSKLSAQGLVSWRCLLDSLM
jgi:hypothetical protein